MVHLWNGILLGLALSILVGPILFALVQVSLEQGWQAGIWVALGIWISDFLFVGIIMLGVNEINQLVASPSFKPIVGTIGGLVLIFIGVSMFISKPKEIDKEHPFTLISSKGRLWLNGFLINTINPFTVIFWTSVITSFAIDQPLFSLNSFLFFGGILGVIMLMDSLKVVLAEGISKKLKPIHIALMRRISGMALFLFGIILFVRVFGGL